VDRSWSAGPTSLRELGVPTKAVVCVECTVYAECYVTRMMAFGGCCVLSLDTMISKSIKDWYYCMSMKLPVSGKGYGRRGATCRRVEHGTFVEIAGSLYPT
jgi:hypothetical protein